MTSPIRFPQMFAPLMVLIMASFLLTAAISSLSGSARSPVPPRDGSSHDEGNVRGQEDAPDPNTSEITLWYGDRQVFGRLGHPQRWVNVLGHVSQPDRIASLTYSLNGGPERELSFREDFKRIARDGDFNVEVARDDLRVGENRLRLLAHSADGGSVSKTATVIYNSPQKRWPLPYRITWSEVDRIDEAAQVVDGHWRLTEDGVRTVTRYYDRVLAIGDASWSDYEVRTTVTFHAFTAPRTEPNTTGVTHAAIALRWPGHDADGLQPSVKWYPLGATAEFRLTDRLDACRWRIFDGKKEFYAESERRRSIALEMPYHMVHRVETLGPGESRYRVKLWPVGSNEPDAWDLERHETDDLASGSALLIAHHADVTFGDVTAIPTGSRNGD